jgi:uncharacterized protein (TIGR00255 family)
MKSMTGFGRAEGQIDNLTLAIEVSSVNRRTLEVSSSLPREWQSMERLIQDAVQHSINRGKIQLYVRINELAQNETPTINPESASQFYEQLKSLAQKLNVPFEPNADFLLKLAISTGVTPHLPSIESAEAAFLKILQQALKALDLMREKEGIAIATDLKQRLALLQKISANIESLTAKTVPNYRELLMKRLRQTELDIDLNDERILKEIALFADKCDISEEITRLNSHLKQMSECLDTKNEPVGRKMDFLCQEIFRELNTTGTKANHIEIIQYALDGKAELERIREQIQNIE